MTRLSSEFLLRRAYEHVTASAAAITLTLLTLLTVNAHAGNRVIPSVTIQVPTVEIEVLEADTASHVAAVPSGRVNG